MQNHDIAEHSGGDAETIWHERVTSMVVGDPQTLAIESGINSVYEQLSQRALGFFVIHVGGRTYGVRSPEATLLACSFDAVKRRIAQRGKHSAPFASEPVASTLVDAVRAVMYDESRQREHFFGTSADELRNVLISQELVWAPDGDAAFDDGSHVLQFDRGDKVRLVAFKNVDGLDVGSTLSEIWLDVDEFYGVLDQWQRKFEADWAKALKLG